MVQPNCKTETKIERNRSQKPQSSKESLTRLSVATFQSSSTPRDFHDPIDFHQQMNTSATSPSLLQNELTELPRLHLRRHRKLPDSSWEDTRNVYLFMVTRMSTFATFSILVYTSSSKPNSSSMHKYLPDQLMTLKAWNKTRIGSERKWVSWTGQKFS